MHTTDTVDHSKLERLVRQAGDKLLELWPGRANGRTLQTQRKADGSLVTEADFASHQIITDGLRQMFPNDFILSEEDIDEQGYARAEIAWILDPLDGTEVYARGENYYAIFLSRRVNGDITEAVMYYPERGQYFKASRGRGATCNGEKLRVFAGGTTPRPNAVFPEGMEYSEGQQWCRPGQYEVSTRAFMGLCCGEIDGVVVHFKRGHFYPWDFAPGVLIIEECGGRVSDECNQPLQMSLAAISGRYIVASNGFCHQDVLQMAKS